jgi:geranylgeranyl pyrophosphate synthase
MAFKKKIFSEETQYFNLKLSEIIEQKMREAKNKIVNEMLNYIKEAGGKKLRPIICFLSAEAVGGNKEKALFAAIAIELVHNASLVHDDIIDENYIRRKNPSNPAKYGEKRAIVMGDFLFGLSCEMLAMCGVPEVVGLVSRAVSEVSMGQYLEFALRNMQEQAVTEQLYLKVAELKTASLFRASAEAGAILGGGGEIEIEKLRKYGNHLGIAFQIQDDVLDICGNPVETGETVGLDIKNGEPTILVIHALNHAEPAEKKYIRDIVSKKIKIGNADIDRVRGLFVNSGSIDYALQLSNEMIRKARNCIDGFGDSEAKKKLKRITDFTAKRNDYHTKWKRGN